MLKQVQSYFKPLAVTVVAVLTLSSAQAQYPPPASGLGRCPSGPCRYQTVFVHNDGCEPARVVLSSASGVYATVLAPGAIAKVPFSGDRPRVLTAFALRSGCILSNREVALVDGQVLSVNKDDGGPLTPGGEGVISYQTGDPTTRPRQPSIGADTKEKLKNAKDVGPIEQGIP
jgi:hypothetical protein